MHIAAPVMFPLLLVLNFLLKGMTETSVGIGMNLQNSEELRGRLEGKQNQLIWAEKAKEKFWYPRE
jgi:hypothetical protein